MWLYYCFPDVLKSSTKLFNYRSDDLILLSTNSCQETWQHVFALIGLLSCWFNLRYRHSTALVCGLPENGSRKFPDRNIAHNRAMGHGGGCSYDLVWLHLISYLLQYVWLVCTYIIMVEFFYNILDAQESVLLLLIRVIRSKIYHL